MMLRLVTKPKFYFEEKPLDDIKRALEKILRTKREMHAHVEYKVEQTKRFFFFLLRTMPE
jgi:hypothetical protein